MRDVSWSRVQEVVWIIEQSSTIIRADSADPGTAPTTHDGVRLFKPERWPFLLAHSGINFIKLVCMVSAVATRSLPL